YLADGLDAAERTAFEAHVAECPECARDVEESRGLETRLNLMFVGARPRAGLSDRMIHALRTPAPVIVRRPLSLGGWVGIAAAAVVMIGVLGAGMVFVIEAADEQVANVKTYAQEADSTRIRLMYDRSASMDTDDVRITGGAPVTKTEGLGDE